MAMEFFRNEMMNKLFVPLAATGTVATATVAVVVLSSDDSNNGKLGNVTLTSSMNSFEDSVSNFTNDNGIYVDASGELIFDETLVGKTLEQLENEGVYIPEGWDRMFDFKRPVFTENGGEFFITLTWVDGRAVFDEDVKVSEIGNGLVEYIDEGNYDMEFTVNVPDLSLDFSNFNYTEEEFILQIHALTSNDVGGSGVFRYDEEGLYDYFTPTLSNLESMQYNFLTQTSIGDLPDGFEEFIYCGRPYVTTDGNDYYFQMYWADGSEIFNEAILINNDSLSTRDDVLNQFRGNISNFDKFSA